MSSQHRCWLFLEKSDETRISKGIDGYQDKTGEVYRYDSLVPNFTNVKTGDVAILRKEDQILGLGRIGDISEQPTIKVHRRCPECKATDIRERHTKSPKWKCGKCAIEFVEPLESTREVRSFTANIHDFAPFENAPSVLAIKSCAKGGAGIKSQLSILELNEAKLRTILEGAQVPFIAAAKKFSSQGFGLSPQERRAVESRAMEVARQLYEGMGWAVIDTSKSNPFDLLASKNGQKRYLEVKGTTGAGQIVLLTHGEVAHARKNQKDAVLIVVGNIELNKADDGWIGTGGTITAHRSPWIIEECHLAPTCFRYNITMGGAI